MTAEEARKLFSPDLNLSPEARSLIAYIGTIRGGEVPYDRLLRLLHISDEKKLRRIVAEAEDSGWLSVDRNARRGHHPTFDYSPPKKGTLSQVRVPEKGTLSVSPEQQILEESLVPVVLTTNPPVGPPLIVADGKAPRRRGSKFCPADWEPSEAHRTLARSLGVDFEHELQLFRDHEFAHPYTDWVRAFVNWLRRGRRSKTTSKSNGIHLTPAQLDAQGVTAVQQKTRMQVEHEARLARRNGSHP